YAPIWANETLRILGELAQEEAPVGPDSDPVAPVDSPADLNPSVASGPTSRRNRRARTPGIARTFGSSLLAEHRSSPWRTLLILVVIGALAGGTFYLLRHRKNTTTAPDARLHFDVQPRDAVIEVEGQPP